MKRVGFSTDAIHAAIERENRTVQPVLHDALVNKIKRVSAQWDDAPPLWLTDPALFCDDPQLNHDEHHLLLFLVQRLRSDSTRRIGTRALADRLGLRRERVLAAKNGLITKRRIEWHDQGQQPGSFRVLPWAPAESVPPAGTELQERQRQQQKPSSSKALRSSVPPPGTQERAA